MPSKKSSIPPIIFPTNPPSFSPKFHKINMSNLVKFHIFHRNFSTIPILFSPNFHNQHNHSTKLLQIWHYKCMKRVSKNKLFYRCINTSCENTFIGWCKSMNEIELTARRERDVNDTNDVHRIVDYVMELKDKLCRV